MMMKSGSIQKHVIVFFHTRRRQHLQTDTITGNAVDWTIVRFLTLDTEYNLTEIKKRYNQRFQ